MTKLRGILPAVVTPVDEHENFARPIFARLLERFYDAGVDGVYVCGQTGEGMHQGVGQRKAIAEAAAELSPHDKAVIVHVGANSVEDAFTLARHAAQIDVRAISSLPPKDAKTFSKCSLWFQDNGGGG